MELLRLENVEKIYHPGEVDVPALRGISLSIHRGEFVALMGASGSGKSTLMNILGCLDRPSSGKYWLDGQEVSRLSPDRRARVRSEKIGFVFQNPLLLPRTSAMANIGMPLEYALRRSSGVEARRLAATLLARVGLSDRGDHRPAELSGGQQQRVAIARALANGPRLLLADEPTGNLDSHTSDEILRMFEHLNLEGMTVILVTHDPRVAAYAHRIIRIHDGQIQSDETPTVAQTPGSQSATPPAATLQGSPRATRPTPPGRSGLSFVPPTFRTALHALGRNKLRAALTALGVIIGVAAVIAMMEIGQGSATALRQTIASMGANNLIVEPGAAASGGVNSGAATMLTLTPQDADAILSQCAAVSEVAPMLWARAQVVFGNRNWVPLEIIGTTASLFPLRGWDDLDEGETFTDLDVRNANRVCVVGQTLKHELFQDESPLGKEIRVGNVSFRVVGVLSRKGASTLGFDQDDVLLAPWTTVKFRVSGTGLGNVNQGASASSRATNDGRGNTLNKLYPGSASLYPVPSPSQAANMPQLVRFANIETIHVKTASPEDIPQAIDEITGLLRQRHRIRPGQPDDFSIRDMTEAAKALASTSQTMRNLLLVVALVSLVVGGVGIMNIMLVSVTQRTREIGLRMAVGARSHHILRQFLVEAMVLCVLGGTIGVLVGRGASKLVRSWMGWPTEPSLAAIVAALAISAMVGIVSGVYPAWKASRFDPVEVLRYE